MQMFCLFFILLPHPQTTEGFGVAFFHHWFACEEKDAFGDFVTSVCLLCTVFICYIGSNSSRLKTVLVRQEQTHS